MSQTNFRRDVAFQFLFDIQKDFVRQFSHVAMSANAYGFNSDFKHVIKSKINTHLSTGNGNQNKTAEIHDEMGQVISVMERNIDTLIDNNETIENLVTKSEHLDQEALLFKFKAKEVNNKNCCQNYKWSCIVFLIIVVIIYVALVFACGGLFLHNCVDAVKN